MATAPTLTPTEVIDRVRSARRAAQAAAVQELEMALEWARLHPCPAEETPAHWGEADLHGEGLVPLAGPGAPWVAEFAPAALAAALGISQDTGRQLVADALELAHRLPRLWERVVAGAVPVWRARLIARESTDLSIEAALFADRLIAATPTRIGQVQAARLVQEARLYFDPDRGLAEEEQALTRRGVWLRHGTGAPATTDVVMTLDTPDAWLFDQTLTRIAGDLHDLGDTETLEVRRARAVGILADPQHALDLLTGHDTAAAPSRGARTGATNLYVHLTPTDLERRPDRRHRCCLGRAARRRHHRAAHRLAHPVRDSRHQDHPAPRPRPRLDEGCGPARPTRGDAGDRDPARRPLRLPRLPPRLPGLRPRPHHRIPTPRGRRTTGPNPTRQPRTPVPDPPPRQDPHRMALQTPRPRQLRVDRTHRPPAPRHPCPAADPDPLTARLLWWRPLVGVRPLVSSDRSLRSLLDHLW